SFGMGRRFYFEVKGTLLLRYCYLPSLPCEQRLVNLPAPRRIDPQPHWLSLVIPMSLLLGIGPQDHVDAGRSTGTDALRDDGHFRPNQAVLIAVYFSL